MRSAARLLVPIAVLTLGAVPAVASAARDGVEPPPIVTAYGTTALTLSEDLSLSPLNPALVAAPGGAVIGFRATPLSDPDPQVSAWLHDLGTGRTESAEIDGSVYTRVMGISADGDTVLLADELGRPHLRVRSAGTTLPIQPPDEPAGVTLAAIALGADGASAWLQWAAPISDPTQRSAGLARWTRTAGGEGTITLLDEPLPVAGSPSLEWSVQVNGDRLELAGPSERWPLPELGDAASAGRIVLTDPQADGTVVVAFISTDPSLPGAGADRCGGVPCAEVYRARVRNGTVDSFELLSIGDDGTRLDAHASDVAVSPGGKLVAFTTATPLVADRTSGEVPNVFLAGTPNLRAISAFRNGTTDVQGGRLPLFLTDNDLLFYAESISVSGLLDAPSPGIHIAQIQPFDDLAITPHEGAVWWAVEQSITTGCTPDRFCPGSPVTRGQVASFLARAFGYQPVADGPFTDVAGVHAGAINALAQRGITQGCGLGRFCSDEPVTRGQVASLLARALGLDPVEDGAFVDISGVHAGAINAIASAGITNGCAPDRYCPDDAISRAQMMTFLYRTWAG